MASSPKLTISEEMPMHSVQQSRKESVLGIWWLEITSAFVSIVMLAVVVVNLRQCEDKPLPKLPYHLSINTILSIVAIVMKACGLLLLAEGLSQLKWEFYKERRPIHHFSSFDAASRGPWGCLVLIYQIRFRQFLPVFGALVTILALVLDPFLQSIVTYYPCSTQVTNGSVANIPRTSLYDEMPKAITGGNFELSTAQQRAVVNGFNQPGLAKVQAFCPTGNCTFPGTYASYGYCSECSDVTSQLRQTTVLRWNKNLNMTQNVTLSILPSGSNATSSDSLSFPRTFTLSPARPDPNALDLTVELILPMANYTTDLVTPQNCSRHAWLEDTWGCRGGGAARCSIGPCVKTYTAGMVNGILTETVVDTYKDWFSGASVKNSVYIYHVMADLDCVNASTRDILAGLGCDVTRRFIPWNVLVEGNAISPYTVRTHNSTRNITLSDAQKTLIPKSCIYQGGYWTYQAYLVFLSKYLRDRSVEISILNLINPFNGSFEALAMLNETVVTARSLGDIFEGIASSITERVRTHKKVESEVNAPVTGIVNIGDTCVRVRWIWILYPLAIVTLWVIFLVLVLFQTERRHFETGLARGWKSSLLPLIYHPLKVEPDVSQQDAESDQDLDIRAMRTAAKTDTAFLGDEPEKHQCEGQEAGR